jgi:replication initiator protein
MTGDDLPSLTALQRRIVDAVCDIAELDTENPEFLHAVLCQCGLPRSRPKERIFERSNGNASMRLEAGALNIGRNRWVEYPLPYGTKPRLVLYHLCSEAIRTQSPLVDVGGSIRTFLSRVGISYSGPEFARFKAQMTALSVMRMMLAFQADRRTVQINTVPVHRFEAWLHPDPHQASFWPDTIQLSAEFFETLVPHAVPLDPRAIGALQHSALALDVYTWLAHRLCRVRKADGVKLSWGNLRQQFGQEYSCSKDFKKDFRAALLKVRAVYPAARIDEEIGGIRLYSSPAPVPKSQVVVQLPSGG